MGWWDIFTTVVTGVVYFAFCIFMWAFISVVLFYIGQRVAYKVLLFFVGTRYRLRYERDNPTDKGIPEGLAQQRWNLMETSVEAECMDRGMFIGLIFCLGVLCVYFITVASHGNIFVCWGGWGFFVWCFPGIAIGVACSFDGIRKETRAKRLEVSVNTIGAINDYLRQLIAENNISGVTELLEQLDVAVKDIAIYHQGDSSKLWRTLLKN